MLLLLSNFSILASDYYNYYYNHFTPPLDFVQDYPGKLVPER